MGGDLVLDVSTLMASIRNFSHDEDATTETEKGEGSYTECRICQEQDDLKNLESPCRCSGSVKYAHRKCIQLWCDEKGSTTCEICNQEYRNGYQVKSRPLSKVISSAFNGQQVIIGSGALELPPPRVLTIAVTRTLTRQDAEYAARTRARINAEDAPRHKRQLCYLECAKLLARLLGLAFLMFMVFLLLAFIYHIQESDRKLHSKTGS